MNNANKENINKKRKRTESFDKYNNPNEFTAARKILKLDNNTYEEQVYFDNKLSGYESMKIMAYNQVNSNIKTSNLIGSINKKKIKSHLILILAMLVEF